MFFTITLFKYFSKTVTIIITKSHGRQCSYYYRGQYGRYIPNTDEHKVAYDITLIITSVIPKRIQVF